MMRVQARFVPHLNVTDKEPESPSPAETSPKQQPLKREASFSKKDRKELTERMPLPKLQKLKSMQGTAVRLHLNFKQN